MSFNCLSYYNLYYSIIYIAEAQKQNLVKQQCQKGKWIRHKSIPTSHGIVYSKYPDVAACYVFDYCLLNVCNASEWDNGLSIVNKSIFDNYLLCKPWDVAFYKIYKELVSTYKYG